MAQMMGNLTKQLLPRWRRSLPFRVGVLHIAVAAALMCASLWIIFTVQDQERRAQELNQNLSQGQLILAKLQLMITELNTLAIAIADIAANPNHNVHTLKHTLPSLLSLPQQQNMIASAGIWPEPDFPLGDYGQGHSLFWVKNTLGELNINNSYNDAKGYLDESWYKPLRLFPAGKVHWSASYIDPHTHESMVSAAAPIWKNDRYQGTATIDVSLSSLTKFTQDAGHEHHGYVILLDQFNRVLAAPTMQNPETSAPFEEPKQVLDINTLVQFNPQFIALQSLLTQADSEFIRHSMDNPTITQDQWLANTDNIFPENKAMYQALVDSSIKGSPQSPILLGTLDFAIDPYLATDTLVSVYRMPGTYWKVVTVTPKMSFKHEALLLAERAGIFVLLAQIVALVLLYLIQKNQFIKPIAQMVRALKSNNAAYLELDANGRDDEIGILAKAFLARTEQLEIAKASLDASNLALEQQLAVQTDIQQDLLGYKEHLLALLKSSPNLIYIKDINGRYLVVNDKFCETVGLDRDRMLGSTDQQLFSSDLAVNYSNSDRRAMAQDTPLQVEETLPALSGEQRFQFIKFSIRDDEDNLKGLGAIAFDIKKRKRDEEEWQARIQMLEANLEGMRHVKERQQFREQQLEQALAKQIALGHGDSANERAWQTERRLLRTWQRTWLDTLTHEHDGLLSLACQSDAEDLESIRTTLMQSSNRLRLADNLIGRHRSNHVTQPKSVLVDLKTLFEPELKRLGINLRIEGDDKCAVSTEIWQLTLLFFRLLQQISHLEALDNAAANVDVQIRKADKVCIIRFERQGVNVTPIDDELAQLCHWLQQQCSASLSKETDSQSKLSLECYLPLAS